ncbi:MAG: efflux RND transporter periplasmic adaptor subunit, partial [Candidatus Solibacter sp.]|nr:efflux RND transporter periplasmic adaptor subunit [Candidatus Solibacter sp.]
MKKAIFRTLGLVIVAAGCWYGYNYYKQMPARQEQIPTAKVQRGDVVIRAYSRGELRAARVVTVIAPNLFGTVQVTDLSPVGALAKEKDLLVEYDDSERQSALEESRLSVQSDDEQLKRAKADLAIQQSQDAVTLLKTRYNVRRAELEVQRNPIIAEIDGKKNVLTLEQQKRALLQLETDMVARQEQFDSQLAVLQEHRNRTLLEVQRELQRIALCKSLAPITGLVAVKQNRAGMFNFGTQMPDIREGDTLQPGMPVVDILDLSEVEVWAKVGELDRANLKEGQEATLQLDAIPDKRFNGKIKAMSGTATSDVFSGDPSKKFDVIFAVDMPQLLAGVGMKPADIARIMATAAANAKKGINAGVNPFAPVVEPGADDQGESGGRGQRGQRGAGGGGGRRNQDGGAAGGAATGRGQGGADAQGRGQGGADAQGRGGRGGFANLSEDDRKKMTDLRQKMQAASPEEREKLQKELTDLLTKAGITMGQGRGGQGRGTGDAAGGIGGDRQSRGGGGFPGGGGSGGQGRGGAGAGAGAMDPLMAMMRRGANAGGFTDEDRASAKLPLPPEQDSQVAALLRPGLLADVEIQVEKLPDVIHVPAQAVFRKNDQYVVFVQQKNGKFQLRQVQLVKQSESMMVISSGVQAGEMEAMADPTSDKKKNG